MPDNPTVSPTRLASIRWPAGLLERIDAAVLGSDHPHRNALVIAAVEAALAPATGEGTAQPTREEVREALVEGWHRCPKTAPSTLDGMTDAVLSLLSRSAAGPSEETTDG